MARDAVRRGGVLGRAVVGPRNRGARWNGHAENAWIEIEVLNGHRRNRPRGRRHLRSWRGRCGHRTHASIQREDPECVAAWVIQLEVATRRHGHVLLAI